MLAMKRKVSVEKLQEEMRAKQPTPAQRLLTNLADARAARLQRRLDEAEKEWREKPRVYDMLIHFEEAAQRRPAYRLVHGVACYCGGDHKYFPPDPVLEAWWLRTQVK